MDESVRLFEQVVALDPEFARGWEGLAAVSVIIVDWKSSYPSIDEAEHLAKARHAADRALALDPTLSLPWAARSLVAMYARPFDHAESLALVDRAIEADPRNATAFLLRGIAWLRVGFIERALADYEHCLAIDPAYGNCLRWKANALLFLGQTDAAIDLYEQGVAHGFPPNRGQSFIEPLIRRGDTLAAWLLMRDIGWPLEVQQAVMVRLRDGTAATDVAALVGRHPEVERAQHQWGLLLRDYALAAETPDLRSSMIEHWDPALEGLRASPAFKRLLERFNVPAYWRAHGYPPQCRAVGDLDFECDQAVAAP